MKMKIKTVERKLYKLSLSANEGQELLENIVDVFYQLKAYSSTYKNDTEVKARFPALTELANKLQQS